MSIEKRTTSLVITTIQLPTEAVKQYAECCLKNGWRLYVAGDERGPNEFKLDGATFMDIASQEALGLRLGEILPKNHYARKNIAYLKAISDGCDSIIETDDDNFPMPDFEQNREYKCSARQITGSGWHNVYRNFSQDPIWPRGLPLDRVNALETTSTNRIVLKEFPIQQGLANGDPDVDAVYRMVMSHKEILFEGPEVYLSAGVWSPFNSQNTTWFKEAFPLLYLPSYCSFRMTDIWRSLIAQRLLWTFDRELLFHQSTVHQYRNAHDLMKDFEQEVPGYLYNGQIAESLGGLSLKEGYEHLADNMRLCYEMMIGRGWIGKEEGPLVEAWLEDISDFQLDPVSERE